MEGGSTPRSRWRYRGEGEIFGYDAAEDLCPSGEVLVGRDHERSAFVAG